MRSTAGYIQCDVIEPICTSVVTGLEWDLYKNLYGQHMAQDVVSEAVVNFLQNDNPDRPLVLAFHGASGTGKSLVSSMVGRHIYGTAMGSPYIHQYVPTLHFPSADRVPRYRVPWVFIYTVFHTMKVSEIRCLFIIFRSVNSQI